jgi:hypothetical protein
VQHRDDFSEKKKKKKKKGKEVSGVEWATGCEHARLAATMGIARWAEENGEVGRNLRCGCQSIEV